MISVIAIITAKPGMRDALLKEAKANIPKVLAEDGCIEYAAFADAEGFGNFQTKFGPDILVYVEKWASPEALKAHGVAPHMAAYAAKTKDMVADRVIHVLAAAEPTK